MPRFKIENIPLAVRRGIKFRILADEREKTPWTFARYWKRAPFDYCNCTRLVTADYTINAGENYIAIERKNVLDFLNTLSLRHARRRQGQQRRKDTVVRLRDRFEVELERMQKTVQNCYVICEAPLSRILQAGTSWKGQLAKALLLRAIMRLKRRYPKIRWEFYENREAAEARAFYLLYSAYLTLQKDGVFT